MIHQICLSGSFRFVADRLDQLSDIGYSIVGLHKQVDGNWIYLMEKEIRSEEHTSELQSH